VICSLGGVLLCCVVWEEYILAQLLFTGWSGGLDADKRVVGRDRRLHWRKLHLINVLSLEFLPYETKCVFSRFHSFKKTSLRKNQCSVRSEHCLYLCNPVQQF